MAGKKFSGLAASFDLESFGLDPIYGRLLCGVVKPWGEAPKIFRMNRASSDDSELVKMLVEELSTYSILFAHNGLFHDRAFLNGRALHYDLPILDTGAKLVDPYLVAKKHLNSEVWGKAALDHDEASMQILIARCVSDCEVLEQLARRVLALVGNINPWGSA
jgi:hypothetical protein